MEKILERIETPVTAEYDVVVVGGGIAGAAAALAAARNGAKTALLERGYMLGGLATAGLVTYYLPICDGKGHLVSAGIAEELLKLSISMGAEEGYPKAWIEGGTDEERCKQRYMVRYNAQLFAMLLEQILKENGVHILYGVQAAAVPVKDGFAQAVVIEGKSGREAIRARAFVDATGDADLFHLAGAQTELFQFGNILAAWYYRILEGKFDLCQLGFSESSAVLLGEKESKYLLGRRRFKGLTTEDLSEMTILSHQEIMKNIREAREKDPDCVPVTLATTPQVRMTRRMVGVYTLDETINHVSFDDEVGRIADWRRRGYEYGVPYRALYGSDVRNLIAAGRCISVTDKMWDISRVIPCCAVTGEAAGTAAALTGDFAALDPQVLRSALVRQGVNFSPVQE